MPCSFAQTTNLPVNDHLIMLIDPSPEWSIVSLPVFVPSPILLNHPEAAAAALLVLAFELTPLLPPIVSTKLPALPPEIYVRSLLYSGDKATADIGLAKFRSVTSFGSSSDDTQTWPSIEEVAMYIELDGEGDRAG